MIVVNIEPEILVALITAGFAAVAAVGVELLRRHRDTAADIAATREQVQNSHKTNLRDDIDNLHDDVREVLTQLTEARADLRVEREERLALSKRLNVEREERLALSKRFDSHTHAA